MGEDAGSGSPKTLADVSHLFFSGVGNDTDEPSDDATEVAPDGEVYADPVVEHVYESDADVALPEEQHGRTRVLVVTGGEGSPGKSTLAVNLSHALAPHGRVALFDADTSIPNARYFLGLPSWHYLSSLTGEGESAPDVVTDSGVLVGDWSNDGVGPADLIGNGTAIYADVPDVGRTPLDFVVVDVDASNTELLSWLATRCPEYIVASRPGRRGFERTFVALRSLRFDSGAGRVWLVVNEAPSEAEAREFHAKTETAARRLLSMEVCFLGAVPSEPGLGAEQRERGALVASRPDAAAALALRSIATNLLDAIEQCGWTGG
jgi:MinD-like ATPase involved in chromosome partitioning or flagellar assembly